MQLTRRSLISTLAASIPVARAATPLVKITQIALAPVTCQFHKFVAMNAYDREPKGRTYTNTLVRISTDQGVEGVGVMGYPAPDAPFLEAVRALVGVNPLDLYEMKDGCITGRRPVYGPLLARYRHLDGPLFDLIGKITGKPAWKLLGESVRDRVEVYDGTLYFSDIWLKDWGVGAVVEEAEEALKAGYRGIKLKIGRGSKWMEKDAGLARDIEVIRAVRKAVGKDLKVMADANDGFREDPERAWRLLSETADASVYWIEEIFPENVDQYSRLRERMQKAGLKTLIADGENLHDISAFEPYLRPARLMDVIQMDIRTGGFLDSAALARGAERAGAVSIPHNWGSTVGGLMGLQISKAVRNIPAVEDDRSRCDAIQVDGYEFRGGLYTVPEKPGLSIHINERAYDQDCKSKEVVVRI